MKKVYLKLIQEARWKVKHIEQYGTSSVKVYNRNGHVMIDASHDPIEKNIQRTKLIVEKAHKKNISVEARGNETFSNATTDC